MSKCDMIVSLEFTMDLRLSKATKKLVVFLPNMLPRQHGNVNYSYLLSGNEVEAH